MALTVRFGNLTVDQFAKETGVEFSLEDKEYLEKHRQNKVDIKVGEFHIFANPLGIEVSRDISGELISRLRKYDFNKQFTVTAE